MARTVLRDAAATTQLAAGLLAVLLTGYVVAEFLDSADLDLARLALAAVVLGVGGALFGCWVAARSRRGWLLVLATVCGSLTLCLVVLAVQLVLRGSAERAGLWFPVAGAVLATLLWMVITAAAVVEWRCLPAAAAETPRRWVRAAAVVAPLAVLTACVLVLVSFGPGWLIRWNSESSTVARSVDGRETEFSGTTRWTLDVATGEPAVTVESGIAVPTPADAEHSAGVVLLNAADGSERWRYALRGTEDAPRVASTDEGRAVVVWPHGGDDVVDRPFTLDVATGRVRAVWPGTGAVADTEPPVLFDHVARGTNSVIAISPTGRTLWTHRPDRCADPRSVHSTPTVMLVRARNCDQPYPALQLIGLDARTGEQRWVQDVPEGTEGRPVGGEDGPSEVVVGDDHQVELTGAQLARRDLTTGALTWTKDDVGTCDEQQLVGTPGRVFLTCLGSEGAQSSVTAHDRSSGEVRWRQSATEPVTAVAAVDDERVVVLTSSENSCTVRLVDSSGERTVLDLPGGDVDRDPGPGAVRCREAHLLSADGAFVLAVQRADVGETYRFIGLQ